MAQAQLFWRQPRTVACTCALRGLRPGGILPGELPARHQPLPWHGPGVSRGESLGLAGGAALPRSSGTPRSKTWGQCRDGTGLGEQSQGPGPAGLRQRGISQRQLAGSSPKMFGSRERCAALLTLSNYTSGMHQVCVSTSERFGHRSGVGVRCFCSGPQAGGRLAGDTALRGPTFRQAEDRGPEPWLT